MVLEDKAFRKATLQSFIAAGDANRDMTVYPLAQAFPVEEVEDIENVYNIIETQLNVAAAITGFNSGSPIRTRGQGKQAMAKLTKIQDAYFLQESDLIRFNNPRSQNEANKIIRDTLINTNNLSEGVEKTKEFLRAQMAYQGKFEYNDPRTETQISFKLDRPQENNLVAAQDWGTEDATPLTDLKLAIEQYKKTNGNKAPEVITMNSKILSKLKRSGQIKTELFGDSNSPRLIKESEFNMLLNEVNIPAIQVDDSETAVEQIDGTAKIYKHMPDGRVVLRASVLGNTLSGPAVENDYQKGKFVEAVISQDPHTEKTIVGEVTLPITKNLNGTVFLDVLSQTEDTPTVQPATDDGATA